VDWKNGNSSQRKENEWRGGGAELKLTEEVGVRVLGNLDKEGQIELETDRELEQQLVNTVQPLNITKYNVQQETILRNGLFTSNIIYPCRQCDKFSINRCLETWIKIGDLSLASELPRPWPHLINKKTGYIHPKTTKIIPVCTVAEPGTGAFWPLDPDPGKVFSVSHLGSRIPDPPHIFWKLSRILFCNCWTSCI
jgi:hypothetical protein